MRSQVIESKISKIYLNHGVVYLEDFEDGKGKVLIESYGKAYSYYWGAMGKGNDIRKFIQKISDCYFVGKLLGARSSYEYDSKKTFKNLRGHIKELLPWYKYLNFQKEMREAINRFQNECESSDHFIFLYSSFAECLNYYEINCDIDRKEIKEHICYGEPWNFIGERVTGEYKHLCNLHEELILQIQKPNER